MNRARGVEAIMVIEYIRYELPEDRVDEFVSAYARAAIQLSASRHCLSYDLARGVEQPGNVVVRIEWDSIEGHEQHFTNSPRFEAFIGEIRPWLGYVVEMRHYAVTQVTSYGSASRGQVTSRASRGAIPPVRP